MATKRLDNASYVTTERLDNVTHSIEEIGNIIQGLSPNKAHSQDKISIRMLKICANSICNPLEIIYKECLSLSLNLFSLEWKKGNIVPIHEKGDRQCLKNYRPVSLLPVCGKILEKLISDKMLQFFIKNKLIATNQSGFKPVDSCINQLLSITQNIYKSFHEGYEVRGMFLDISKAFDKVWHDNIIFKLKQNGISENLMEL